MEDVDIDTVLEELEEANDWLMDWEDGRSAYRSLANVPDYIGPRRIGLPMSNTADDTTESSEGIKSLAGVNCPLSLR